MWWQRNLDDRKTFYECHVEISLPVVIVRRIVIQKVTLKRYLIRKNHDKRKDAKEKNLRGNLKLLKFFLNNKWEQHDTE